MNTNEANPPALQTERDTELLASDKIAFIIQPFLYTFFDGHLSGAAQQFETKYSHFGESPVFFRVPVLVRRTAKPSNQKNAKA